MKRSFRYNIRKWHRYLGLVLGVQFLLWTLGGLYFSWSNLDEIHGDFQRASIPSLRSDQIKSSPTEAIQKISELHPNSQIKDLRLIRILGSPLYQITYSVSPEESNEIKLIDATTGEERSPLSEQEAIDVAKEAFIGEPAVERVEYLTEIGGHHEYRGGPLPAYAIRMNHPSKTTVYVSQELGTVQKFRNEKWRVFDFLWMLHVMDYEGRDNISNWLLRLFSIFGIVTILSGFALAWVSRRKKGWLRI